MHVRDAIDHGGTRKNAMVERESPAHREPADGTLNLEDSSRGDFGTDTEASTWYKAVATQLFATEAFDCATTPYYRLFSLPPSSTKPLADVRSAACELRPVGRVAQGGRATYGLIDGFARYLVDDRASLPTAITQMA